MKGLPKKYFCVKFVLNKAKIMADGLDGGAWEGTARNPWGSDP